MVRNDRQCPETLRLLGEDTLSDTTESESWTASAALPGEHHHARTRAVPVNASAIAALKEERRAALGAFRVSVDDVGEGSSKLRAFYEKQNEYLDSLETLDRVSMTSIERYDPEAGGGSGGSGGSRRGKSTESWDGESWSGSGAGSGAGSGSGRGRGRGHGGPRGAAAVAVELSAPRDGELGRAADGPDATPGGVVFIVRVSLVCNLVLFAAKVFAAFDSGSLAVFASAVDSALDLISGAIMFVTERAISRRDPYQYPVGRRRLEPLGIIVFASVMGTAALQLILTGVERLASGSGDINLSAATVTILVGTVVTKLALFGAAWLVQKKHDSGLVDALATDHITDVFTNLFGLAAAIAADLWLWWIDPVCGILLAIWIIRVWASTGKEQLLKLTGKTAPHDFLRRITYMAAAHHPDVVVDTVRAVYFGTYFLVEIDLCLPPRTPLYIAHDIGESLQNAIESLNEVERCFVHLDTETDHHPEHKVL